MKYLLIAACCLLGCHPLPEGTPTGDDASDTGTQNDATQPDGGGETPDMGPGVAEPFRTTQGLVAQFSMRDDALDGKIIDDLDERQSLTTMGGEDVDGALILGGNDQAAGPIVAAATAIAASGKWTVEQWIDIQNSEGQLFASGDVSLSLTRETRSSRFTLRADDASFLQISRAAAVGVLHIVTTYDGATVRIYVNGFNVGASNAAFAGTFDNQLIVGGSGLAGRLEYLALYDRALGPGEVGMHLAVGPEPPASSERDTPTDTIYAHPYGLNCGRATGVTEKSIHESFSQFELLLGEGRRALQRFAFAELPPYAGTILFAGYRQLSGPYLPAGPVGLYQMHVDWSADATWTNRTSADPWESEGAEGATDRAAEPLASRQIVDTQNADYLFFDVTGLVTAWLDGSAPNFGWMILHEGDTGDSSLDSSESFAARPAIIVVGAANSRPAPPVAPTEVVSAPIGDDVQLQWAPDPARPEFEIYRDGYLWARTSQTSILLTSPDPLMVWEVFAIDGFGQRSAGAIAP